MEATGRTVGGYEIIREIGSGGMATVYVARQRDLDRQVALKELSALATLDQPNARRFMQEARLAGSLSHQNIVTVHDYFEHDDIPYIAMEYLARGSLRPYVSRLTMPQIGGVLGGVLAGLAHAERSQIVHRDIKPENVLVTVDGGVKIADFGIAKARRALEQTSTMTAVGTTVGTPNYIAPEQAMAREVGPWTDLYSLGITAFELLVGKTPFGDTPEPMGIVLRHINEPVPRVSDLVPSIDPATSDWVGWLVSKDPGDRPRSAGEAWQALEEVMIGLLGPRWAREAPLLGLTGESPALAAPTLFSRRVGANAGVARHAGSSVALSPPKATRQAVSGVPRETRPDRNAGPATTLAPRHMPTERASPPPPRPAPRSGRFVSRLEAAATAVVLVALGVTAATAHHSGSISPRDNASKRPGSLTTGTSPSATSTTSTTSTTTSAARQSSPTQAAGKALGDQVAPARKLAQTYQRAAARISRQSGAERAAGENADLAEALRTTSQAYRQAASAAAGNDLAGYTSALASAATARHQVSTLLSGLRQTHATTSGDGNPTSVPGHDSRHHRQTGSEPDPQRPRCAGDSTSDDPSDDQCGN